jgi:hypothetical protein
MTTSPLKPNSELASMSLVPLPGVALRSCKPKICWVLILIFPPLPLSALAMISLPSFGGLSRTYGDNKILYFVGWVRRGDTFDDKLITFAPRRNPPEDYL